MKKRAFHTKVAGVTKRNGDGTRRQSLIARYCKPGMPVILKREPDNPYDKDAVGVWIKARVFFFFKAEVQIGYLNRGVAQEIARHMDRGSEVRAEISDVTGGCDGKSYGVNLFIEKL